jgi:hypothetical protein
MKKFSIIVLVSLLSCLNSYAADYTPYDDLQECNDAAVTESGDASTVGLIQLGYSMVIGNYINPFTGGVFVPGNIYEIKKVGGFSPFGGSVYVEYYSGFQYWENIVFKSVFGKQSVQYTISQPDGMYYTRLKYCPNRPALSSQENLEPALTLDGESVYKQKCVYANSEFVRMSIVDKNVVMYSFDDNPLDNSDRDYDDLILEVRNLNPTPQ